MNDMPRMRGRCTSEKDRAIKTIDEKSGSLPADLFRLTTGPLNRPRKESSFASTVFNSLF